MTAPTTTSDVDPDSLATAAPAAAGEVDRGLDEDDRPRARWERAIGWGIVALCTLMVFNILAANHNWAIQVSLKWRPLPLHIHFHPSRFQFGDLFRNTTANGGDMGAHVWWPKFLETNWFPKGRLAGWAPDWYAGFPVGQYYFPVPAVMVAILDHIPFVPYNVAFKLVTVSGPLMLPAAAYYFARGMRTPWPAPPAFALAAFGMLVQTRYEWSIFGGNIAEYEQVCEQAREEAFRRMVAHARQNGADAVIAMRYDATEFMAGSTEVLAYGTAVKLAR